MSYRAMQKSYLVVQLLGLLSAAAPRLSKCGNKLLEPCFCGEQFVDQSTMFVVNCTNTGFTNTDVLLDLPEQTEVLIFSGNHIPSLPSNLFGENAYMSRLKVIDLTNNGIREIRGKTFHHVANVERLVLDHNNISIADEEDKNFHHPRVFSNFVNLQELHLTNAFADNTDSALADDLHDIFVNSNLTKLYKLHLEQNEIKNFKDETVFCDLPDLHDLHLGDNDIPSLNFDVTCLRKLRYLDLEFNNITEFTQRELDALDALATSPGREENLQVEVNGNPLKCESVIRRFYPWTQTSRVQVRHLENLECAQAKYGKKYPVKVMSLIESRHVKISQSLTVLLAVLLCVLISLMVAYFYLKRDQMRSRFSPILEAITRKVQYTTIEAQDV